MADPKWLPYAGTAIGIVVAITGIWGLISSKSANKISKEANRISKDALCKVDTMKSLDLRLELRKAITQLNISSKKVSGMILDANESRRNVSAARGSFHSGAMKRWNEKWEKVKSQMAEISEGNPKFDENYDGHSQSELEDKIIAAHTLQSLLNELENYFQESLNKDEEDRKQIKEDNRVRLGNFRSS